MIQLLCCTLVLFMGLCYCLHRVRQSRFRQHQWPCVLWHNRSAGGKLRIRWRSHWKDNMERKVMQKGVRLVQRWWWCFNNAVINESHKWKAEFCKEAKPHWFFPFCCKHSKNKQTNKQHKTKREDDIDHLFYKLFLLAHFWSHTTAFVRDNLNSALRLYT